MSELIPDIQLQDNTEQRLACVLVLDGSSSMYGEKIDKESKTELIKLLEKNLKILHPFMPFLTEEIYHNIPHTNTSDALTNSSWPANEKYSSLIVDEFEITKEIISNIRNYRKEKNISFKTSLDLSLIHISEPTRPY